ncbi:DUF3168 domain-containing protein [Ciceribacter sp. L1K23]|uniref:DUF3168 domain-containing protein n=1 Tax=Ciceribacter sp. L1K23 TaxID=2820276 RepID=UPI001B8338F6|nr:DUF3168 domain-containing protein [Ciceribacter sp. L1K23]MBR0556356.1 DUF3168 domain-containing protein [Ciceribacter sp. L1K23]
MTAVNELLAAVFGQLAGDAAVTALVGGEIHDRRLDRIAAPCLMLSTVETRDYSTVEADGLEVVLTFEAWSATGRREAEEIAGAVRDALHGADLSLPTARLASLAHQRTTSRRAAKSAMYVAEVRLRAVIG